jgi:thiosulfate dehydrogenase (quinone) large subunit
MKRNQINTDYSGLQIFSLTSLRVLIGWHFLYEGFVKLLAVPSWTAKSYLLGSVGPLAPVFKVMASNPKLLNIIDKLNIWGLILIGLCLFTGLFARPSKILGICLLLLYYFAYPPFGSVTISAPVEGNYWIVNKNLIEAVALFVLYLFPVSQITGIDSYFNTKKVPV